MEVIDYCRTEYYHPPYIRRLAHLYRISFAISVLRAGTEAMDFVP